MKRYLVPFSQRSIESILITALEENTAQEAIQKTRAFLQENLDRLQVLEELLKEETVSFERQKVCHVFSHDDRRIEIESTWEYKEFPPKYHALIDPIQIPSGNSMRSNFNSSNHIGWNEFKKMLSNAEEYVRTMDLDKEKTLPGVRPLNVGLLADFCASFEKNEEDFSNICFLLHPREYADIRKWGRDVLEVSHEAVLMKNGIQSKTWGYPWVTQRWVPEGLIVATSVRESGEQFYYFLQLT